FRSLSLAQFLYFLNSSPALALPFGSSVQQSSTNASTTSISRLYSLLASAIELGISSPSFCHISVPSTAQSKMAGASRNNLYFKSLSTLCSGICTENGISTILLQIPSSVPRIIGL